MNETTSWVDVITDGRIWRSLLYLLWVFFSGTMYVSLLAAGFGTAIGLSFILIGIPLLVMAFAGARGLAVLDHKISGVFLNREMPPIVDDIPRGQSIFRRLGSLLGSPMSWLSIVYLLTRFVGGMFAITVLPLIMPLLALEVLILAPLGITGGTIAMHIVHGLANGIAVFSSSLLPVERGEARPQEKAKRNLSRLQVIDEGDDQYYIDEEGEIVSRRRG
jgi:hypothetical protein